MTGVSLTVSDLSVAVTPLDGKDATPVQLVYSASFTLNPRETLALVGGSGSGKSITSMAVMRLLDPARFQIGGSVKFGEHNLLDLSPDAMRHIRGNRIAMIFQEPMTSLNPLIPIGTQIAEVLRAHGESSRSKARARALDLLKRVALPSAETRLDDYPHQFSGGQRQRILIASALACNPDVLIADEPTTALDVTVQAKILELLRELQEERDMSVLFITHDMGVVAQIADRVAVMHKGRTIETGPAIDIFDNPTEPYTRSLLSAIPCLGDMAAFDRPMRYPIEGETAPPPAPTFPPIAASEPILVVNHLRKHYPKRHGLLNKVVGQVCAVEDVSFAIRPGETLSLVGESGCGKSTTGRTIIRLQDPTSGTILFEGNDLEQMRGGALRAERSKIQMIFQDPYSSLNPRMTVADTLMEPMLAHKTADRPAAAYRAAELLEQVGLDPASGDRYPSEFSGGQRQRISIARALALNPRLIVADEAVSALDVVVKAQIVNLMLDLQESLKLAYLFISHDMTVVERVSHRVAVMSAGRIVEIGSRAAIFGSPQHPYTRKLLAAVPLADPRQRGMLRNPCVDAAVPTGNLTPSEGSGLRRVGPDHYVLGGVD